MTNEFGAEAAGVAECSYSAVRHVIWPRAECVIWLDLPRLLVTYRVLRRTVMRWARRKALWNGNRDRWRVQHGDRRARSCLDSSMRVTPSADISASLTVSFAKSGNENSRASTGASVDLPLAGGPDTTT